ncbi:potassium channel family protein [Protofrankia coriariae]|uniref:Potassium transporter n=1 Tax=Protofrankia coriariae TaxID=1562887 RepID=A0ABR5F0W8_9ACTN|nr:TrkA family potassium uptake protein [Protofrankia coriariae]KLL10367.1 potassium transporter [Protofrankia coriariae]
MARFQPDAVLVIGLGRFGSALAGTLVGLGHQVLGVDTDRKIVQEMSSQLTHVVEADTTSEEALRQIGAGDFNRAVVAIGSDVEASILTTSLLVDFGIAQIWAKAVSRAHGRILDRVGAHRVVYPEHDMGERVAHMVTGRMVDYVELSDNYALVETRPPADIVGKPLGQTGIRSRHGVTVVCIKHVGADFDYAHPDTVVKADDLIVVLGPIQKAVRFAQTRNG